MFIKQNIVLLIIPLLVSYFICCAKLTSADILINKFTVKQLQEDFRQMRQTLEEDHANLYEYTKKSIMDTLFDRQYELLDSPMTLVEFFRVITPITAKIGCGHTNLWMPGEYWKPEPDKLFPIKIELIEGKVIAVGDFGTEQQIDIGSILFEINGVPIAEIINEMKENYSADAMNENFILSQITRRFSMIYARRFGFPEKFNVTYLSP